MSPEDELILLKEIERSKKYYLFMIIDNDEGVFLKNTECQFIRENILGSKKKDGNTYYKSKDVAELLPNLIQYRLIEN